MEARGCTYEFQIVAGCSEFSPSPIDHFPKYDFIKEGRGTREALYSRISNSGLGGGLRKDMKHAQIHMMKRKNYRLESTKGFFWPA